MKKPVNKDPLPHYLVLELMGQASFSRREEEDISIAEAIASNTYYSLEDLVDTIKGYIQVAKYKKDFEKSIAQLNQNPFWAEHLDNAPAFGEVTDSLLIHKRRVYQYGNALDGEAKRVFVIDYKGDDTDWISWGQYLAGVAKYEYEQSLKNKKKARIK